MRSAIIIMLYITAFCTGIVSAGTLQTSNGIIFSYPAAAEKMVYLVGDWNGFNNKAHRMTNYGGIYAFTLKLSRGEHRYGFIVNDKRVYDPDNPPDTAKNKRNGISLIVVTTNYFPPPVTMPVIVNKSVTFRYYNDDAQTVYVVGSFNHWNTIATPMRRLPDNSFTATVLLDDGEYTYLFFVDGEKYDTDNLNPLLVEDKQKHAVNIFFVGEEDEIESNENENR